MRQERGSGARAAKCSATGSDGPRATGARAGSILWVEAVLTRAGSLRSSRHGRGAASPQGGAVAGALFVVALALAQSWYFHYRQLWAIGWPFWPLLARNVLLVALYAFLLWKTSTPSRAKTSRQSGFWRRRTSAAAAGSGAERSV